MECIEDFNIQPIGQFSRLFLNEGVYTFNEALEFVKRIPYGRNSDRAKPLLIFKENRGTCSTKHAALKKISDEHRKGDILLILSMYRMNGTNTPAVKSILQKYKLDYIPEAHTYLKLNKRIIDCTSVEANPKLYVLDIIEETSVEPQDIGNFKIEYHKKYIKEWVAGGTVNYSVEQIWGIREKCIDVLSMKGTT